MKAERPNATIPVCIKHPVIKPATTAKPDLRPYVALWIKTKILSGPGEIARARVAKTNDIRIWKSKINLFYLFNKALFIFLIIPGPS